MIILLITIVLISILTPLKTGYKYIIPATLLNGVLWIIIELTGEANDLDYIFYFGAIIKTFFIGLITFLFMSILSFALKKNSENNNIHDTTNEIILLNSEWEVITNEEECLDYPQMMSETFGNEKPEETLHLELQRELSKTHYLKGFETKAILKSTDNPNRFIFETDHLDCPFALVHLTWSKEKSEDFPHIERVTIKDYKNRFSL